MGGLALLGVVELVDQRDRFHDVPRHVAAWGSGFPLLLKLTEVPLLLRDVPLSTFVSVGSALSDFGFRVSGFSSWVRVSGLRRPPRISPPESIRESTHASV